MPHPYVIAWSFDVSTHPHVESMRLAYPPSILVNVCPWCVDTHTLSLMWVDCVNGIVREYKLYPVHFFYMDPWFCGIHGLSLWFLSPIHGLC